MLALFSVSSDRPPHVPPPLLRHRLCPSPRRSSTTWASSRIRTIRPSSRSTGWIVTCSRRSGSPSPAAQRSLSKTGGPGRALSQATYAPESEELRVSRGCGLNWRFQSGGCGESRAVAAALTPSPALLVVAWARLLPQPPVQAAQWHPRGAALQSQGRRALSPFRQHVEKAPQARHRHAPPAPSRRTRWC
jgi:hypothetical protein